MSAPGAHALSIGVDVGGTKVLAGVVSRDGVVLERTRRPTPSGSPAELLSAIEASVAELLALFPDVGAVGIGAAGWIASDRATVLFAPHLSLQGESLRAEVSSRVGRPVVVENDANAAAWAEHRFGAGRGVTDLVMITVGTGLGCGLVLGGQLHRGAFGVAGEPGHMQVLPDGRPCACGNQGCWEQYASGRALVYEAAKLSGQPMGDIVDGVTGPAVTAAAMAGDPVALQAFSRVGHWLGVGMASLAAVLDPALFVIGGGVSDAGPLLLAPARAAFAQSLTGRGHRPLASIELAELGADAGLVGAADLVQPHGATVLPRAGGQAGRT